MSQSLFAALAAALAATEIGQKLALTATVATDWQAGQLDWQDPTPVDLVCGIPKHPLLVPPKNVPQRSPVTVDGRARLLHAIAHIEFSAINLALDHAARFRGMPRQYYEDWIGVAAERTSHDVLERMALVPRLLEARGLDATPPIQKRLEQAGDHESARLLDIILHDEIGHVGLGDRWFRSLCASRGLEPEQTFRQLLKQHKAPRPIRPMNENARLAAGFTRAELAALLEIE